MSSSHERTKPLRHVLVSTILCSLTLFVTNGCGEEPATSGSFESSLESAASMNRAAILDVTREELTPGVYHYSLLLRVGNAPNARLRLHRVVRERAPWQPQPTNKAVLLLHGDFSTFTSNFVPSRVSTSVPPGHGLAAYLAGQGIDVWGIDRRWTTAPADGASLSDFAEMGFAGALEDVGLALSFARWSRGMAGAGRERMFLAGFSRGGHLAYAYTAGESGRPPAQRHVRGLVPIDIYAELPPQEEALRQGACDRYAEERAQLEAGLYDSDNGFFIQLGTLANSAPSAPSPLFEGFTNRSALVAFAAQTFLLYAPRPGYHLAAGVLTGDEVATLRYSSETAVADWLAAAPPHQALAEIADSDALWCGEVSVPLLPPLSEITVPIFYLGAAGGFGDYGVYSTTRTRSADISTHIVRQLDPGSEVEDFGHVDLLYGTDAPTLAWQPLSEWILQH